MSWLFGGGPSSERAAAAQQVVTSAFQNLDPDQQRLWRTVTLSPPSSSSSSSSSTALSLSSSHISKRNAPRSIILLSLFYSDLQGCVIALERTGNVGVAPAIDFILEHNDDTFAGQRPSPPRLPPPAQLAASDVSIEIDGGNSVPLPRQRSLQGRLESVIVAAAASGSSPQSPNRRQQQQQQQQQQQHHAVHPLRRSFSTADSSRRPRTPRSSHDSLSQNLLADSLDSPAEVRRVHSAPSQNGPSSSSSSASNQQQGGAVRQYINMFGAGLGLVSEPSFCCMICSDDYAPSLQATLPCCGISEVCVQCVRTNIVTKVSEADLHRLCPNCNGDFPRDFIRNTVDADTFEKYERFIAQAENPDIRICSRCKAVCSTASSKNPSIKCQCGHVYCFTHGDSHPLKSCAQWARENMASEESSLRFIKDTSKRCPRCKVPTHKSEGCNHMRCSRCSEEWCWLCGRGITPGGAYPAHYKWWNPLGCSGAQFTDDVSRDCGWFFRKLALIFALPVALVLAIVSFAIWLTMSWIWIPCWCCTYKQRYHDDGRDFFDYVLSCLKLQLQILVGVPIAAALGLPAIILYIALVVPFLPFMFICECVRACECFSCDSCECCSDFFSCFFHDLEYEDPFSCSSMFILARGWLSFISCAIFFGPVVAAGALAAVLVAAVYVSVYVVLVMPILCVMGKSIRLFPDFIGILFYIFLGIIMLPFALALYPLSAIVYVWYGDLQARDD